MIIHHCFTSRLVLLISAFLLLSSNNNLLSQPASLKKKVSRNVKENFVRVSGNYEAKLLVSCTNSKATTKVYFSGTAASEKRAYLDVSEHGFKIVRQDANKLDVWKNYPGTTTRKWSIRVLKKGNFFRFWVNKGTGWIRGPLGEWEKQFEPRENEVGVETSNDCKVVSSVTTLPWLQQAGKALITPGPAGSFYEDHLIPGAILEHKGQYYMYLMASMKGDQEGGSRRTVGVAISRDLTNWRVHPEPLISYTQLPFDNLYVNGAVSTPEGKIAVMFSAQKFPEWKGFFLATANDPLGPFELSPENPVYKHPGPAHEFDLVRADNPDYRYILFYAGFTIKPPTGPGDGDRGYLLYSDDLIHWRADKRNPVFKPETLNDWDAVHIRPRSLNKIGDTWYLWYEGCNHWQPPTGNQHGWWDTVGLARSKDLIKWEYYPRNPALPGLGIGPDQFDSNWVGWPRMLVKDGIGYVFYTGNGMAGMRTIPIQTLTNWRSEGGKTFPIVKQ